MIKINTPSLLALVSCTRAIRYYLRFSAEKLREPRSATRDGLKFSTREKSPDYYCTQKTRSCNLGSARQLQLYDRADALGLKFDARPITQLVLDAGRRQGPCATSLLLLGL